MKTLNKQLILIIFIYLILPVFIIAESYVVDFSSTENIYHCNMPDIDIIDGKLRLSKTGRWTNGGATSNYSIPQYLFQDSKSNLFFIAGEYGPSGCIYKSTNYGVDWIKKSSVNNGGYILETSDEDLYASGFCCGAPFYKSTNNGNTWNIFTIGPASSSDTIFEDSDNNLYAWESGNIMGIKFYAILNKCTNLSGNWQKIYSSTNTSDTPSNPYFIGRSMLELNSGHLISASSGIFISSNKGTNWTLISGTENISCGYSLFRAADNSLYTCGLDGIMRSKDEAKTWERISSQLCVRLIEGSDNIFYKTCRSNVWKSFNKGYTWFKTGDITKDGNNFGGALGGNTSLESLLQASNGKIYVGAATNEVNSGYVFYNRYIPSSEVHIKIKPLYVKRWLSFSKQETLNGGNVTYEFTSSHDGGNTWDSWQNLTDENLNNVQCFSNGKDMLKVKMILNLSSQTNTPEIDWFCIDYAGGKQWKDLGNVVIAPNPFTSNNTINYIQFYNLTPQFELRIYSIKGKEVYHIKGTSINGCYKWDTRKRDGEYLKSGVYICYIKNNLGQECHRKIVIIR